MYQCLASSHFPARHSPTTPPYSLACPSGPSIAHIHHTFLRQHPLPCGRSIPIDKIQSRLGLSTPTSTVVFSSGVAGNDSIEEAPSRWAWGRVVLGACVLVPRSRWM
ncbi:hypothetical protein VTO73DRAFT_5800 [Trametes versicolor]